MERVRDFTVKFTIVEDVNANAALDILLAGSNLDWPDFLVGVEYLADSEITREATQNEKESMGYNEGP